MNRTAYLVAFLDTTKSPPAVKSVSIYSEDAFGLTYLSGGYCHVDVLKISGEGFEDATRRILDLLTSPYGKTFAWTIPFLEKTYTFPGKEKP